MLKLFTQFYKYTYRKILQLFYTNFLQVYLHFFFAGIFGRRVAAGGRSPRRGVVLRWGGKQADTQVSGATEEVRQGDRTDEQQDHSGVFVHGTIQSSQEHRYLIMRF